MNSVGNVRGDRVEDQDKTDLLALIRQLYTRRPIGTVIESRSHSILT